MNETPIPWTIFIFCFNEVATVGHVIEQSVKVAQSLSPDATETLVVDDGSTDGSAEVIREKCRQHPTVRAIHHRTNKGIGAALRTGYSNARGLHICGIPADGQFNVQELLPFASVEDGTVIAFSRMDKGYNGYRWLLSTFNNWVNRLFLGLNLQDVNWVKIYKRADLHSISLKMNSSLIESEICAKLSSRGARFEEVRSIYHVRTSGETKGGSLRTVGQAVLDLSRLIFHVNLFRLNNKPSRPASVTEPSLSESGL